jgi:peptidyl-prolyl cis-trans isomerase C
MRFTTYASAASLALAGLLTITAGKAEDNVAVVNGMPIPQARLEYLIKSRPQQPGEQQDPEQLRKGAKDYLITLELLAQAATQKGLDKSPEVLSAIEMAKVGLEVQKEQILARAYFEDLIKNNALTDEQLKAEYERVKAQQTGGGEQKEYRARHILIKDEKAAKAVLAQVNKAKAKNFATLAKAKSEDPGSKADGGLLDWTDGSNFVPEFSAALVKLGKGEWTTQLVKSNYGYHIILVEDIRPMQFPPFESVKDRVAEQMMREQRDKAIEALRAAAKIE